MKRLLIISLIYLLSGFLSGIQAQVGIDTTTYYQIKTLRADTLIYKYKSDTTHYDYLFYSDNSFVRCEPGIVIESGIGCDQAVGYFIEEPKREIYTDSGKPIKEKDLLYYIRSKNSR